MAMVFCRGCGREIDDTATRCPHCGAAQSVVIHVGEMPEGGPRRLARSAGMVPVVHPKAGLCVLMPWHSLTRLSSESVAKSHSTEIMTLQCL